MNILLFICVSYAAILGRADDNSDAANAVDAFKAKDVTELNAMIEAVDNRGARTYLKGLTQTGSPSWVAGFLSQFWGRWPGANHVIEFSKLISDSNLKTYLDSFGREMLQQQANGLMRVVLDQGNLTLYKKISKALGQLGVSYEIPATHTRRLLAMEKALTKPEDLREDEINKIGDKANLIYHLVVQSMIPSNRSESIRGKVWAIALGEEAALKGGFKQALSQVLKQEHMLQDFLENSQSIPPKAMELLLSDCLEVNQWLEAGKVRLLFALMKNFKLETLVDMIHESKLAHLFAGLGLSRTSSQAGTDLGVERLRFIYGLYSGSIVRDQIPDLIVGLWPASLQESITRQYLDYSFLCDNKVKISHEPSDVDAPTIGNAQMKRPRTSDDSQDQEAHGRVLGVANSRGDAQPNSLNRKKQKQRH